MKPTRRFSILTFPQLFDGERLSLNIVVLPRNQNPLLPAIEQDAVIPDARPFANAKLSFEARIITGLASFPTTPPDASRALGTQPPARAEELFRALGKNFDIANPDQDNSDLTRNSDTPSPAVAPERSVKKYLPVSYRTAFNFTTPRTPNAVTDDSYHCAVRGAGLVPGFKRSKDTISWGKVFAYAMRHPLLAAQLGMIYTADFEVEASDFPKGGWLYVDLADDSDYKPQQQADSDFIRRYAARIPPLELRSGRPLFAPLQFPVLRPAEPPDGIYDNLFIEAAAYDDGFAKIVHAHQPRSRNLLAEESDGAHPVKDAGIRLGWDDEQILIWYMRQMTIDQSVSDASGRLEAPLGVFGYAVDVREARNPPRPWESLTEVRSKQPLAVPREKNQPNDPILLGDFEGELPYQVYPAQLDGDLNKNYWLPMYFANWNGNCMVLPDADAASIYQTTNPAIKSDPEVAGVTGGTKITGPAENRLTETYAADPVASPLRYGHHYQFRVRMRDLSGGGAEIDTSPVNISPSSIGRCQFKRYVAPNRLRIENLPFNTDTPQALNQLSIRRPLLGYPAAVYTTSKYVNPVQALKDAAEKMRDASEKNKNAEAFGIADPDVDRVEITVEVQTLKMDNLLSVSGKENYVHLYTTRRNFPAVVAEQDYDAEFNIPLIYKDCNVLHTGEEADVENDLGLAGSIDDLEEIFLPTARVVRLTMRAVCEDKPSNDAYYGLLNAANDVAAIPNEVGRAQDVRFGQIAQVALYSRSTNESELFIAATDGEMLRGIYLQPDPPPVFDGNFVTFLIGKEIEKSPDMIQRLAKELDLENIGLTLTARKGERVVFGCSNRIRHALAPDNSSLTFSSKGDLMNHWLCCVTLTINRDWMWDALESRSFVVKRRTHFTHDREADAESPEVGDIEVKRTASFEALHSPKRAYTRLVFIDAVEPKNPRKQPPANTELRFPDTIDLTYSIEPSFKANHGAPGDDDPTPLEIVLPVTTTPTQVPKIASAGLALSPYTRNDKYSATEPRQRFLWIEFAEPLTNPSDTYFARVLAYTPDQLISNNHPELFAAPQEPALPIDPEYTRLVTLESSNDLAGLSAMQPMQKAVDSDVHYLLPLPPGLHAEADEMFGFFTYEFRVGHYRWADAPPDADEADSMVWCTAQGRFGRPLRATGIQHPAPTLMCAVNRDEEKLYVTAPFAAAVFDGKNVTALPPRTELWCLLYAQVRQADNKDNRNILLDERQLDWRVRVESQKNIDWLSRYREDERQIFKDISYRNARDDLNYYKLRHSLKLKDKTKSNKDSTKYGTALWSNDEIAQLLSMYGLPEGSSLSVLVVEVFGNITNLGEYVTPAGTPSERSEEQTRMAYLKSPIRDFDVSNLLSIRAYFPPPREKESTKPLSETLGHHRILRTSPLTEVPYVC
ncbi:MAG: hypothetical protein QOJ64_1017 [Acidobacteriota bacterium]|jgi:hypothetical protein|nr:hypothetical protein [Acidobacteriota bacterium]